jgi:RNA polymerase sigma-70 factor (ECF subfamily)
MPNIPRSDLDLWLAVRNDSESAFAALFERYWDKLYATAFRYTKDHEFSEELVHDIFLSLWTRRKALEINVFQNFMLKAVRYQIYNDLRTAKLPLVQLNDWQQENYGWEANKGSEHIAEEELVQQLFKCLEHLPRRCQEIFRLSRINNLSNQEIASQLGISKRTVENQLSISLKHLKVHWNKILLVFIITSFFQ